MKLYAENGQVFFDYTDVEDTNAGLDGNAIDYRRFIRETDFCLKNTDTPKVASLPYSPWSWTNAYGNACELMRLLGLLNVGAKCNNVEIDESFKELYNSAKKRCDELRAKQIEKEQKQQEQSKWQSLCKYGCESCENKRRCGDDYFCTASGDLLPEKTVPAPSGRVFQLFNYTAFPTENCPYNINKNKEINNYAT